MNKTLPFLIGAILSISACGQKKVATVDLSDVPIVEIVATHAIETKEPVRDITFVPNDVAPWLGRIVTTHPSGTLYSTDIEGRNPDKTGSLSYASVFGLDRPSKSGVFLASSANKLEAFIEKNDEGQFSAISTSGPDISIESICSEFLPTPDTSKLITTDFNLLKLKSDIMDPENGNLSGLEYKVEKLATVPKVSRECASSGDEIYTLTSNPDFHTLHHFKNDKWTAREFPTHINISSVVLNDTPYLIVLSDGAIYLMETESQEFKHRIIINSGLSIAGLDSANLVSATPSNFGGGAFGKGLIAFSNNRENRIVFISLEYLEEILKSAQ